MFKFIAALLLVLLAGCNTINKENFTPYKGLLPDGATPEASTVPLDMASLNTKTVVIVTSASFHEHVKQYDYHEHGAGKRYRNFLLARVATYQKLSGRHELDTEAFSKTLGQDPRMVGEEIGAVLAQSFAKVGAATTFAEAIDMKADYIVLADYWWTIDSPTRAYISGASVHLLDKHLKRYFVAEARAPGPILFPTVPIATTIEQMHTSLSRDLQADLRRHLSAVDPTVRAGR